MKYIAKYILPLLLFFAASSLHAAEWRNYTLQDGKFMIELPGQVEEMSQVLSSKSYGELTQHQLLWKDKDFTFRVSYTTFPRGLFHQVTISDFLNQEEQNMASDFNGKISMVESLKIHNYPGRKFTTTIGDTGKVAQVHLYVVQNRLYTLVAESSRDKAYSYFVSNFFESFKMGPSEELPEIEEHLSSLGYEYKVDQTGRYQFTLFLSEERSQVVFVLPGKTDITQQDHYLIWTPVSITKEMPTPELANELLVENGTMEIGSFQVVQVKEGYLLMVAAKMSHGQELEAFQKAIFQLTRKADSIEKKVTQKDDY